MRRHSTDVAGRIGCSRGHRVRAIDWNLRRAKGNAVRASAGYPCNSCRAPGDRDGAAGFSATRHGDARCLFGRIDNVVTGNYADHWCGRRSRVEHHRVCGTKRASCRAVLHARGVTIGCPADKTIGVVGEGPTRASGSNAGWRNVDSITKYVNGLTRCQSRRQGAGQCRCAIVRAATQSNRTYARRKVVSN